MIYIKYFNFKNKNCKDIQISKQKENAFKVIYQIINQKINDKQSISLEQLVIFCSFKSIKKIREKTNYQEIQKESINKFLKYKSNMINFKNLKNITIEIMVDDFPKNVINFSI